MRRRAREYAIQILYALDLNPAPVRDFLKMFWELNPQRKDVVEYANYLVQGTVDRQKRIDELIVGHSSHWRLDRMAATDRNILRLATFELLEEQAVPPKVVMDEAIEIAKKYGSTDSASFINGVLDSIHQALTQSVSEEVT